MMEDERNEKVRCEGSAGRQKMLPASGLRPSFQSPEGHTGWHGTSSALRSMKGCAVGPNRALDEVCERGPGSAELGDLLDR
jgi:hypothetical protein